MSTTPSTTRVIRPALFDGHMLGVPGTSSCVWVFERGIYFAPDPHTHGRRFELNALTEQTFRAYLHGWYSAWAERFHVKIDDLCDYIWMTVVPMDDAS